MSKKEHFEFTADQIGSEILERFSADIYSPKAIVRELVKNAYDSYYQLEKHFADADIDIAIQDQDRAIEVAVVGDNLSISDKGLGLDFDDFKLLISIALTEKRDVHGVTGFRGIGFWSAFTAGNAITVKSTKFGDKRAYTLTLDTKRMRALQGPATSIAKIMNDPDCMQLVSDSASEEDHSTTVIVHASATDGRVHELVRNQDTLRKVLLDGCSCRLTEGTRHADSINTFYKENGIVPARLNFQGSELTRDIPGDVGTFIPHPIKIAIGRTSKKVAVGWYATNKANAGLKSPFAGIRMFHNGFPIGPANPYAKRSYPDSAIEVTRPDLLDWHIGEVHLLHEDLRPNASGEELRDTTLYFPFRDVLRHFYEETLIVLSRTNQIRESERKGYAKDVARVATMANKVSSGQELGKEDVAEATEILTKVHDDNKLAQKKLDDDATPTSRAKILRDDVLKTARSELTSVLKKLQRTTGISFSTKRAAKKPAKAKKTKVTTAKHTTTTNGSVIQLSVVLAAIDEIRDAVIELMTDDLEIQAELLERINGIATRLK